MGIQSFNQGQEKPINIDFPEENEFDSSKKSKGVTELEAKIKKVEEEILAYENRLAGISEKEEEKREMLDNILDQKKIFLLKSKKELEALIADKLETDFERDSQILKIFRGKDKDNKPEIIQ